jgi:hypothetical protein
MENKKTGWEINSRSRMMWLTWQVLACYKLLVTPHNHIQNNFKFNNNAAGHFSEKT